ncbi:hypothetical protein MRX96_047702 [Rhipicephalus microplus]
MRRPPRLHTVALDVGSDSRNPESILVAATSQCDTVFSWWWLSPPLSLLGITDNLANCEEDHLPNASGVCGLDGSLQCDPRRGRLWDNCCSPNHSGYV